MAIRLSGIGCWVSTVRGRDGDHETMFLFCQSRLRGLRCPREGEPDVKPFELSPACFSPVRNGKESHR